MKGICSDDSDMLPLGGLYLFKDMLRFMSKGKSIDAYSLNKSLVRMNLTLEQFQDLCVLLGCDYCDNIKGIGPKTAYKLISQYDTLENVLDFLSKKKQYAGKIDKDCLITARNYFRTAVTDIDNDDNFVLTDDNFKLRKLQEDELLDFLCVKHNFDTDKVQAGINRLKKCHQKMGVTRPNTKKAHIISKQSKYLLHSDTELEFISDETNDEDSDTSISSKKSQKNNKQ